MTPPTCLHCGEVFDQHEARGNERWCRDGQHRFDFEFHISPALIAFLQANPDRTTEELTKLWIERLSRSKP